MQPLSPRLPPAVNYHINRTCNAHCRFCFATFRDVDGQLPRADALRLIDALRAAGAKKLNLAGGEPTLHAHVGALLAHARSLGFVTSIVTNGARLAPLLDAHASDLDWVGLSVDSADEAVEIALGRSRGGHVARSVALADQAHQCGVRLKLNTVVTALNCNEDLSRFVRRLRPARWKVFQVLPMAGQNDGAVEPLLVDRALLSGTQTRAQTVNAAGGHHRCVLRRGPTAKRADLTFVGAVRAS